MTPDEWLSIVCGMLLITLFWLSLLLASGVDWKRIPKYLRVAWYQNTTREERRLLRIIGRGLWIYILILVGFVR